MLCENMSGGKKSQGSQVVDFEYSFKHWNALNNHYIQQSVKKLNKIINSNCKKPFKIEVKYAKWNQRIIVFIWFQIDSIEGFPGTGGVNKSNWC